MRISAFTQLVCLCALLALCGAALGQARTEHLGAFTALPATQSDKVLEFDSDKFNSLKGQWLSKPLTDEDLFTLGKGWVATGGPSSTQTSDGIEIMKQLSSKGLPAASLTLGLWGTDPALARSVGDAKFYFEKAAKAGDPVAEEALGRSLLTKGGTADASTGFDWLTKSVQAGNVAAKPDLAAAYEFGIGTPADIARSDQLFRAAVDTGQASYMLDYAEFKVRNGAAYSDNQVATLLKTAANRGNTTARFFLANQALNQGDASASSEAIKTLNSMAEANDDSAMVRLGELAEFPTTGEPDLAKAEHWLRQAAENGNVEAKGQLGKLYLTKFADQPDKVTLGEQLLASAANAGNPGSMIELAYEARSPHLDPITRYSHALTGLELSSGNQQEAFRRYSLQACDPASAKVRCEPMPVFYFTNRKRDIQANGEETYENVLAADGAITKGTSLAFAPMIAVQHDDGSPPSWGEIVLHGLQSMPGVSDLTAWLTQRQDALRQQPNTLFEIHNKSDSSDLPTFMKYLHASANRAGRTKVFLYVHGFANSFESAIERMAFLSEQYNAPGIPVVFSWASANTPMIDLSASYSGNLGIGYVNDMRMVGRSCDAFQQILAALVKEFGSGNVMVLAHSMGSELVVDMLTSCAKGSPWEGNLKLGQLIFAAPDVDQEEFKAASTLVVQRATSTALYASQNDIALAISAKLGEPGSRRVGQGGSGLLIDPPVQSIDASPVEGLPGDDPLNHGYVFDVRQVRADVAAVLRDTPLAERDCITDSHGHRDLPGTVVGADPNEYWIVQANCQ